MTTEQENWRAVPGFEDRYEVSTLGRVRSLWRPIGRGRLRRREVPHILSPIHNKKTGYLAVNLSLNGGARLRTIHRLVAYAFLGQCPKDWQVNHKNGVKTDNALSNLEYVSHADNVRHAFSLGLMPYGESRSNSKLTIAIVREIRARRKQGVSARTMARDYGVGIPTIENVFAGSTWKRVK